MSSEQRNALCYQLSGASGIYSSAVAEQFAECSPVKRTTMPIIRKFVVYCCAALFTSIYCFRSIRLL